MPMEIKPIHTKIEKLIELRKGTVVMESPEGFPAAESNIYMLSPTGETLWKADKPKPNSLYTKVKLNEDASLSTFTSDGQFCELDVETGKITGTSNFQ
ncbi:MAG: hypothetical protein L6Q45_08565 [Anaerolineales bacterium]|nr:hypothetical protein [Anaerolineales bacterium]